MAMGNMPPSAMKEFLMRQKVVLIIDDDKEFIEELQDALLSSGIVAVVVDEGYDTVSAARKIQPDAILIDYRLRKGDGLAVARKLRAAPDTARIPIVLMSGYFGRSDTLRPAYTTCVDACLSKPFNQRDVVMTIGTVLTSRGHLNK